LCLAALGSKDLTPAKLDQIEQTGSRIVAWDHRDVGPDEIAAIQERGLRAWVYTVNDTQRAAELIRAGVDGIITDVPGKMLELMATSR
jgi:glycerophosphoryl diester phosphodiesterase